MTVVRTSEPIRISERNGKCVLLGGGDGINEPADACECTGLFVYRGFFLFRLVGDRYRLKYILLSLYIYIYYYTIIVIILITTAVGICIIIYIYRV